MALGIEPRSSRGYELSFGASLAKVGREGCKVFYVWKKSVHFDFVFVFCFIFIHFIFISLSKTI